MFRHIKFARKFCSDGSALRSAFLRSVKPEDKAGRKTPVPEPPKSTDTATKTESAPKANFWQNQMDASSVDENLLEFMPSIKVIGVGGGGCNAVNNMINRELKGVDFICANTDAQHLAKSSSKLKIQLGRKFTQGLGCGADPNRG
jgi:phosphoglycerate dehydrogenase-like enzyme